MNITRELYMITAEPRVLKSWILSERQYYFDYEHEVFRPVGDLLKQLVDEDYDADSWPDFLAEHKLFANIVELAEMYRLTSVQQSTRNQPQRNLTNYSLSEDHLTLEFVVTKPAD